MATSEFVTVVRRWEAWIAAAYVVVCTGLAAGAFLAPYVNPWPFWLVVLLTLPLSLPAYFVDYIGLAVLFGVEEWWLPRVVSFVLWIGVAVAQVVLFWWLRRSAGTASPPAG